MEVGAGEAGCVLRGAGRTGVRTGPGCACRESHAATPSSNTHLTARVARARKVENRHPARKAMASKIQKDVIAVNKLLTVCTALQSRRGAV
eukprot:3264224-Rhodomonas_salina.1